jgi:hypothetical protein
MKINCLFLEDVISFTLVGLSCIVLATLFYFQPKISDDWYLLWQYQNSSDIVSYWIVFYKSWTGKIPLILLSSILLPQPLYEMTYRLLIVLELLALIWLSWRCATERKVAGDYLQVFILFGVLLWLSLPVRYETISWLGGTLTYLVPGILGLLFIIFSKNKLLNVSSGFVEGVSGKSPLYFLIGFLAGSSQEQIIVACMAYSLINLYQYFQLKTLKFISINYWILLMGFSVGALFLIAAPGNHVRLNLMDAPGLFDIAKRMTLYISSAFFEIGTGELGKPIWMGILLLFALFYDKQLDKPDNVREAKMWLCVSFATLLTLIPATNQISPRTTFFAVIFLYIAVATFLFKDKVFSNRPIVSMALLVTSALVLVESIVGLIANISIASEFNHRWALINANQSKQMTVPFIATIPSNLTYIQTPEQDREFLKALSAHVGFKVEHDTSEGAPLPASLKPLKAIKFQ